EHPLESGDPPHLLDDDLAQLRQRAHALKADERFPDRVGRGGGRRWIRLELETRRAVVTMDDSAELPPARDDRERVQVVPSFLAERSPYSGGGRRNQPPGEGRARE